MFALAEGRVLGEPEALVQFHVQFHRVYVAVFVCGNLRVLQSLGLFVGPVDGGRGELIEPFPLSLRHVPAKRRLYVGCRRLLGQGHALKRGGEAIQNRRFIQRGKLQIWPGGTKPVQPVDQQPDRVVERFGLEPLAQAGTGERLAGGFCVRFSGTIAAQLEVAKACDLKRLDPLGGGVKFTLRLGGEFVGKQLPHPVQLDGRGQAEQRLGAVAPGRDLSNLGDDEQRRLLNDTLANQRAAAAVRQFAVERASVAAHADLVGERGEDAEPQRGGFRAIRLRVFVGGHAVALGQVQQLTKGRLGLAAGAGVDAVCPAVVDVVKARARKLPRADQHLEVGAGPIAERFLRGLHFFVVAR